MDIDPDRPETMPSDCRPFDGINPKDRSTWKLYVRVKTMEDAVKFGSPGRVKELAYTVREAVSNPIAIFRGDSNEGEPDWLCYVSSPEQRYDYKTGDSRRAKLGTVFVAKFDSCRILQWYGWVKAAPPEYRLPENAESTFDERIL